MSALVTFSGTQREELRRLAARALERTDLRQGLALRRAVETAELDEARGNSYGFALEPDAVDLIRAQAPWLAYRRPDVFGEGLSEFTLTDHGIAERARGQAVDDVVIVRSGSDRIAHVEVKLEGGDTLRFALPFGFEWRPRLPRPSERAMAAVEAAKR